MQNQQQPQYNDEIDLKDLILALWQGKWIIIASVIFALVATMAYLKLVPQTYKANMVVNSIDEYSASTYVPLNQTGLMEVTPEILANLFFDQLIDGRILTNNLLDLGYLDKMEKETKVDFDLRVQDAVRTFSFVAPAQVGDKNGVPYWQIKFISTQPDLARQVITESMHQAHEKVETQLKSQFAFVTKQKQIEIDNAIAVNQVLMDGMKNAYLRQQQASITRLKEQTAIARALGIKENQLLKVLQKYSNNPGVVNLTDDQPSHLQGYVELEERIKQIEQREVKSYFGEDLASAEKVHYMLVNDQSVSKALQAYSQSMLAQGKFAAVRYNDNAIELIPKLKPLLALSLAFILGTMLGVFILIIRNVLREK